jgi:hypothetical protein
LLLKSWDLHHLRRILLVTPAAKFNIFDGVCNLMAFIDLSQEVFDEHQGGTSVTQRGALFHLKQYLKKKSVSADVMNHFTADWEFLEVRDLHG